MKLLPLESITTWIHSPYVLLILGVMSFSESAFFIIPPEVLLIPLALANPNMALWYALITTITSVLGAMFGYLIGKKGGKPILYKLFAKHHIEAVKTMFHKYDSKAIFISAFTPIPFKVFTIAGGVFNINFKRFLIASILGRGSRYFLLAGLIYIFGETIRNFIEHQLDMVLGVGAVGLIGAIGFYKIGLPYLEQKILKTTIKGKLMSLFGR